jgi:hypothetical protein
MGEITIEHSDIQITISGESEHFFGKDLHTKAVATLIEEADIHGWEKHESSQGTNEDVLGTFCAAVLEAIARVYAEETDVGDGESRNIPLIGNVSLPKNTPIHEILTEMINSLRQSGFLNNEMTGSGGLRAEEFEDFN